MITYQQKFDELRDEFAKTSDAYLKAEEAISYDGFIDGGALAKWHESKIKWQDAGNNYHNFMSHVVKDGKKPEDIFSYN